MDAAYYPGMWHSDHIKQSTLGIDRWQYQQLVDHHSFNGIYDLFQRPIPVVIVATTTNATLTQFKIPGVGEFHASDFFDYQDLIRNSEFRQFKKVKFHILEDPSAVQTADHYRTEVAKVMDHVNEIYLNQTGNIKPSEVTATVANARMIYPTVEIVLYSAAMGTYNITDFHPELDQIGSHFDEDAINIILAGHFSNRPGYIVEGLTYCISCDPFLQRPDNYNGKEFVVIAYEDVFDNDLENAAGITVAHEMGHFFNLRHPFFESGTCGDGDGIGDTPFSMGPFWTSPGSQSRHCTNPPSCNGIRRQIENIMDYGEECQWMFTTGQLDVVNAMLGSSHRTNLYETVIRNSGYFANGVPLNVTLTDLRNTAAARTSNNVEQETLPVVNTVYPNPATTQLNLHLNSNTLAEVVVQLVDLSGRLIYQEKRNLFIGSNSIELNVSGLAKGTYLIKVEDIEINFSKVVIIQ